MKHQNEKLLPRLCALLLAMALLFALCACGADPEPPETTAAPTAAQTTAVQPTAETTAKPTTEPSVASTTESVPAAFSLSDVEMTETPNSSCFSAVGYSEPFETLVLTFRDSGKTYLYYNVSASVWAAFRSADSLGRYFNTKIKGVYTSEKV